MLTGLEQDSHILAISVKCHLKNGKKIDISL